MRGNSQEIPEEEAEAEKRWFNEACDRYRAMRKLARAEEEKGNHQGALDLINQFRAGGFK